VTRHRPAGVVDEASGSNAPSVTPFEAATADVARDVLVRHFLLGCCSGRVDSADDLDRN